MLDTHNAHSKLDEVPHAPHGAATKKKDKAPWKSSDSTGNVINLFEVLKSFQGTSNRGISLPDINLDHIVKLTTSFGIRRDINLHHEDPKVTYTLDDNSKALVAVSLYFKETQDNKALELIETYLRFIEFCQQPYGKFLKYINKRGTFIAKNNHENLEDVNALAVWAASSVVSLEAILPKEKVDRAKHVIQKTFTWISTLTSPHALAMAIIGLYNYLEITEEERAKKLIEKLACKLISQLKYDNKQKQLSPGLNNLVDSRFSGGLICAYMATGKEKYLNAAEHLLDTLLYNFYQANDFDIEVDKKTGVTTSDFSDLIETLMYFHQVSKNKSYLMKMISAFNWLLGQNNQHQPLYDTQTGGCFQDFFTHDRTPPANSSVSYLIARMLLGRTLKTHSERPKLDLSETQQKKRDRHPAFLADKAFQKQRITR